jgi:hypothetical protein
MPLTFVACAARCRRPKDSGRRVQRPCLRGPFAARRPDTGGRDRRSAGCGIRAFQGPGPAADDVAGRIRRAGQGTSGRPAGRQAGRDKTALCTAAAPHAEQPRSAGPSGRGRCSQHMFACEHVSTRCPSKQGATTRTSARAHPRTPVFDDTRKITRAASYWRGAEDRLLLARHRGPTGYGSGPNGPGVSGSRPAPMAASCLSAACASAFRGGWAPVRIPAQRARTTRQ